MFFVGETARDAQASIWLAPRACRAICELGLACARVVPSHSHAVMSIHLDSLLVGVWSENSQLLWGDRASWARRGSRGERGRGDGQPSLLIPPWRCAARWGDIDRRCRPGCRSGASPCRPSAMAGSSSRSCAVRVVDSVLRSRSTPVGYPLDTRNSEDRNRLDVCAIGE
jgi:hypothetical protein